MLKIATLKNQLPYLLTILVICAMTAGAELFHESEIIIPEIASITAGAILAPRLPWRTNYLRMFLTLMACAFSGMAIVAFVPAPLWVQMIVAYAVGVSILTLSGTGFAPILSAIVLPVLLQTRTIVFPITAAVTALFIILARRVLVRLQLREPVSYQPIPFPRDSQFWIHFVGRILFAAVLITTGVLCGFPYLAAPPLLVALTELTNPKSKARAVPVKAVLLLSLCALDGTLCRFVVVEWLHWPLTLAAFFAAILMILLVQRFRLYFPPAAAMILLAMLVPIKALVWYPAEIAVGSFVIMGGSLLLFREKPFLPVFHHNTRGGSV